MPDQLSGLKRTLQPKEVPMKGKHLHGMISAALSPVTHDERYDYGLLKAYVDWLVEKGCDCVFALGSTGAFPALSTEERKLFAEGFIRAVDGRVPLCVHIGSDTEEQAVELARHAGAEGADAIAAVPPYYYHYSPACRAGYFARLAAVNPELPFYIYNIPGFTGQDITPAQLVTLRESIPNLAGVKDTTQDYPRYVDYCDVLGEDFDCLMGSDAMCLAAIQTGGAGGICAMAAHNPELMVELFRACEQGDMERARKLQFLSARMRMLMQSLPFMSTRVEILRLRGILDSGFKRPFLPLDAEQTAHLKHTLAVLQEEFDFLLL